MDPRLEQLMPLFSSKTMLEVKTLDDGVVYQGLAREFKGHHRYYELIVLEIVKLSQDETYIKVLI